MSIMWLHLDYNYLCNEKDIYLLEWGGRARTSLSKLFPRRGKQWALGWAVLPRGTGCGKGPNLKGREDKFSKHHKHDSALCQCHPMLSLNSLNFTKATCDWLCMHVWVQETKVCDTRLSGKESEMSKALNWCSICFTKMSEGQLLPTHVSLFPPRQWNSHGGETVSRQSGLEQCFWSLTVHSNLLGTLLKHTFWFRSSGMEREILHV